MSAAQTSAAGNVVPFRLSFLPRHREYLSRWLTAGLPMGLCDADIGADPGSSAQDPDIVMVWVRETADPAYTVRPQGTRWVVADAIRNRELSREGSFEAALNFIRPVLPVPEVTVAA
ncbi:hypothetical protein LOC54_10325 [Acetobacter sp. AN02]|uniref:hypothetical protein n=1 Tax=Acetobacter sp. AN02 TaxID=2894186 RepID=UPI002434124F|nr:hypothetical protein [Acetobacter sp. AN02]MDG6095493.1 hypothetical protein [Acetobacter sp. AN02]